MSLVTGITLPNNGDRIKAENYNDPITKILAQVNGNLDSANIAPSSLPWEVMAPFTNKIPSSSMQDSGNLEKYRQDSKLNFIASGLLFTVISGLNASMSAGVVYGDSGVRYAVPLIASQAFAANSDTYVFVSSTGSIGLSPVANGAAVPSLAAGAMRVAKVVTGAASISSITDLRQLKPVSSNAVDWTTDGKVWWEELGRATANSITQNLTVTITPKKYLHLLVVGRNAQAGTSFIRFNNDAGATQYARTTFGFPPGGGISYANTDTNGLIIIASGAADQIFADFSGNGKATNAINSFYGAAGGYGEIRTGIYRWKGATDITSVQLQHTVANGLAVGTELIVLGHD